MNAPDKIGDCTKDGVPLNAAATPPVLGAGELAIGVEDVTRDDVGMVPGWKPSKFPNES